MPGERQPRQPRTALLVDREPFQVIGVEVAVGHAHRLPAVPAHRQQRLRMDLRAEQRHLPADELGVRPGSAQPAQHRHLLVDLVDGVCPVHAYPVRVARVIAGRAGEVALREDAMGALAAHRVPAEELARCLDMLGQLRPAAAQYPGELRVHRARPTFEPSQS